MTRESGLHVLTALYEYGAKYEVINAEHPHEEVQGTREACFRVLIELSVDAITLLAADGTVLYANHASRRLCGCGSEETVGHTMFEFVHPADLSTARQQFAQLLRQPDAPVTARYRIRGHDGSWRWVEGIGQNLLTDPRVSALVVNSRDITVRQREEEARRASEECYRDLYDEAPHAYHLVGVDGCIQQTNRSAMALLGYTRDELIGRPVLDLCPDTPAGKPKVWRMFQRVLTGQETCDEEVEMHGVDGGQLWVSVWARPMRDTTGAVIASRLLLVDITARKRAEAALHESEQRFQAFMDNSPAIAFIKDAAGRYVYLNKAAVQHFPSKLATWQGKTDSDLWPADTAKQLRANDMAVLTENQVIERIETVPQEDGPHQWLSFKFPLHDSLRHRLVGGMALDITERKRAEAVLNRLQLENHYLQEELKTAYNFEEIVGTSPAIKRVLHAVTQVASTDATVLITGETGTGKELVARALHNLSRRKDKPLIKVNCTALPMGLIESELFGHEKGAFTGAVTRRIGRFELADGGTIFLDEIGDMAPEVQLRLLRVLQEQEFERVGGTKTMKVDVRVIAATNRDLRKGVEDQVFRADLYFRLNVFPLLVPPLRERPEDITLLVHYFVQKYAVKMGKRIVEVSREAMKRVSAYPWPGNIRELEHCIERAVILSRGPTLDISDEFFPPEASLKDKEECPRALAEVEREYIVTTLEKTRGVIEGPKGAATLLKLHPNTLRGRMRKLGIPRDHDLR